MGGETGGLQFRHGGGDGRLGRPAPVASWGRVAVPDRGQHGEHSAGALAQRGLPRRFHSPQVVPASRSRGGRTRRVRPVDPGRCASLLTHCTSLVNFLTKSSGTRLPHPSEARPGASLALLHRPCVSRHGSPSRRCAIQRNDERGSVQDSARPSWSASTWAAPRRISALSRGTDSVADHVRTSRGWRPHDPAAATAWLAALVDGGAAHARPSRPPWPSALTPARRPGSARGYVRPPGTASACRAWWWATPNCSSPPPVSTRAWAWSPAPVRWPWAGPPTAPRCRSAAGARCSATRAAPPVSSARRPVPSGRRTTGARGPTRSPTGSSPRSR